MKIKRVTDMKALFTASGVQWPDLEWINLSSILETSSLPDVPSGFPLILSSDYADEPALHFSGDHLCFLQYTSGSTSLPKGVMITIASLIANIHIILRALNADSTAVVASWLPQYHDMGLIGSVLSLLYCGGSGVYFSPLAFILSPILWLQLASQYRATHLQGPNFAYALLLRRIATHKPTNLDLSSIQHIFDAAEPISVDVVRRFKSVLAPFKLSPHAITGGYGLAESCVYVCDGGHRALAVDRELLEKDQIEVRGVLEENDAGRRKKEGKGKRNE